MISKGPEELGRYINVCRYKKILYIKKKLFIDVIEYRLLKCGKEIR